MYDMFHFRSSVGVLCLNNNENTQSLIMTLQSPANALDNRIISTKLD